MHDYLTSRLASDRRADLQREAADARLAATARRHARTTLPTTQPNGVRAHVRLFLGRAAI
jgi:hypothetical protein